ncbi:hypothetical protein J132_05521 [Termitomyces sp. J132]|nr:hypothetical protein J132_05521 [Termitomyces sp. J132]
MPSRRNSRNSALLLCSDTRRTCTINKLLYSSSKTDNIRRLQSLQVPAELLDRIVEFFIAQLTSERNTQRFASIAPLTLTSRTIRQLTLRRFFHDLRLMSREEWSTIFKILNSFGVNPEMRCEVGSFTWVKNLYTPSKVLFDKSIRLHWLSHLRSLSIDLTQEGLSTQHPAIVNIFSSLAPYRLLLGLIAKTFPCLVVLYLSCTERIDFSCCWACFEDSLGCTLHSPIPDDYLDVKKMANAFATALKPLEHLEHLHLGLFLSNDSLLSSHISHIMEGDTSQPQPLLRDWSECRRCFDGAAADIRRRELEASIVVGHKLKSLKTIGWSSLVAGDVGQVSVEQFINSDDTTEDAAEQSQDEDSGDERAAKIKVDEMEDQDMKTTIWILRSKGHIRVRRTPW